MFTFYFLVFWLVASLAFFAWRILSAPVSSLHLAIYNNDSKLVQFLLDKGISPDIRKPKGVTPIILATYHGYQDIVDLLVQRGADINQGLNEEDGFNPLLNAIISKHTELVERLLHYGAETGLHFAAWYGDIEFVRNCLEQGAKIDAKRNRGMTPLHFAALGNQQNIVRLLIDNGADIHCQTAAQEIPLHQAIRGNSEEVMNVLADYGSNLDHIGTFGSPLELAISEGRKNLVEVLIRKDVDVNFMNKTHTHCPLHIAAKEGEAQIAETLIKNGANVNSLPSQLWGTPLHFAASAGKINVAEVLLRYGADINSKTVPYGSTPLSEARGNQEMTEFLLANGATDYGS